MTNIPNNLKYTDDHDWVSVEGDSATIGLTDFAQSALGDIVFVELPDEGTELEKGNPFGVVESIKSVTDLLSPLSGEVIEVNRDLEENPGLCNSAPYDSWMIKVKISSMSEVDSLMSPDKYKEHTANS